MSARIGYSDEHLSSGSPEELSSPIYATAVGLVLRNIDEVDSNILNQSTQKIDNIGTSFLGKFKDDILSWLANEKNNNK